MATFMSLQRGIDLLSALDPKLYVWVQSATELAVGAVPLQSQYTLDLAAENLRQVDGVKIDAPPAAATPAQAPGPAMLRGTGRYLFEIKGRTSECSSLKDMLKKGLIEIEQRKPGMLEQLTQIRPRTKRIVGRKPEDLFGHPELVANFAEQLMDGWYYGTNNSAPETKAWLKRACGLANLQWGKDFDVSI